MIKFSPQPLNPVFGFPSHAARLAASHVSLSWRVNNGGDCKLYTMLTLVRRDKMWTSRFLAFPKCFYRFILFMVKRPKKKKRKVFKKRRGWKSFSWTDQVCWIPPESLLAAELYPNPILLCVMCFAEKSLHCCFNYSLRVKTIKTATVAASVPI